MRKSDNAALNAIASNLNADFMDNAFSKTVTFVAGTTGNQTTGTFKLATVTGTVALQCFAVNTGAGTLTGPNSTIEVGTATSTAAILPATTCTTWNSKLILQNTALGTGVELTSTIKKFIVTEDVNYLIKVANITGGTVTFYFRWTPISSDGNVVVA